MLEQLKDSFPQIAGGHVLEMPDRAPHGGVVASAGTTLLPLGVMPVSGAGTNTATNRNTSKTPDALRITAISKANPGVATCTDHGLMTGDTVQLPDTVPGMVELNGALVTATRTGADTFTIGIDTSGYTTLSSECFGQIRKTHFQLTGIDCSNAVDSFKGWMLEITDVRFSGTQAIRQVVGNTAANPSVAEIEMPFDPELPAGGNLTYRLWPYLLKPIVITMDDGAVGTLTLYRAGASGGTGASLAQIGKPLRAGESSDPIAIRRPHLIYYAFSTNAATETFYWQECDGVVKKNDAYPTLGTYKATKSITFAGGTPNAIGDYDGTGDPASIFTVTGTVRASIVAVCTTNLTFDANATIELGIAGSTASIITTTDLTVEGLAAQEIWHDATPDSEIEASSVIRDYIITDGNDIILSCGVANTTAGVIRFDCFWTPISADGNVTAA